MQHATTVEILSTARGPLVDPHVAVWGWEIPVYLFLGGWTAGILVLSGHALYRGRRNARPEATFSLASSKLFVVALGVISLGMLALFLDLTHKAYAWRLYVTMRLLSPMSWGAWILLLVYPVLALGVLLDPPRLLRERAPALIPLAERLGRSGRARRAIGAAAMVGGVGLGIYTGVLLSGLGARPLWSSSILAPLFLVSGLSTGAAFAHMASPEREEQESLARLDNLLLAVELALIALFLIGLAGAGEASARAAALLLGGPYTAVFWVGVVGLGIVVPLVIQWFTVSGRAQHSRAAPVMVLCGGLALRFVIVYAGQFSHWPVL